MSTGQRRMMGKIVIMNQFQMLTTVDRVFQVMDTHPMQKADHNLWFSIYPNEPHTIISWLKRVWNVFKILGRDRN